MSQYNIHGILRDRRGGVLVRQSSGYQKKENTGSGLMQLDQVLYLQSLGWPPDQIDVIDARGETGRAGAHRPVFDALLADVQAGLYGIIAVGRSDRLGRNDVDSAIFLEAAAQSRTLIAVGGRIYNPASDADSMLLGMLSKFAEYENKARVRWLMASRWTKAKAGKLRVLLPTGLIWADPQDPLYVERLNSAGLSSWLENVGTHRTVSHTGGRDLYVLPYPDAQVALAVELALKWLLETRDLREVLNRIHATGEEQARWGWPRPGCIPSMRGNRFDPKLTCAWIEGTKNEHYHRLKGWLQHPAFYGAYRYRAPAMKSWSADPTDEVFEVRVENAFPSFAAPADEDRVRRIMEQVRRGWKRGSYNGPRPHALEILRCAEPLDGGGVCGRRLTAMYTENGSFGYYAQGCPSRGHAVPYVQSSIDTEVLGIVFSVFNAAGVEAAVRTLQASVESGTFRRRAIEAQIAQLEKDIEDASDLELKANREKNPNSQRHWERKREEYEQRKADLQPQLRLCLAEEERVRQFQKADISRIQSLASSLPDLLERARKSAPEVVRTIITELVKAVHFRRVSGYAYELEVEFPTGARIARTVFTRKLVCTQPASVWAHGRISGGADPKTVAKELNCAPATKHRAKWTAKRVMAAVHMHENSEAASLREGMGQLASEIAKAYHLEQRVVLTAALLGKLGPAAYEREDLRLWPTREELHLALPEVAKRDMAREAGWPLSDTAPATDLAEEAKVVRVTAQRRARAGSGLMRDASGRLWARRSDVLLSLEGAIARAVRETFPELAHTDPSSWVPLAEALKQFPDLYPSTLLRRVPHVRPGTGYLGRKSIYVWLGDADTRAA